MASLLLTRGPARPIMRRLAPSRTSSRVPVVCFVNGGSKAKIKFRIPKKVAFGQSVALVRTVPLCVALCRDQGASKARLMHSESSAPGVAALHVKCMVAAAAGQHCLC